MRTWRAEDQDPFAAMNADPEVMEHFPHALSREESAATIEWIEDGFETRGWGLWALEPLATGRFIGFTGLSVPSFETHFTPAVEVGWRLARDAWGHGYATEAASASMRFGFEQADLGQIVSFTSFPNLRSQAVMERIGMTRDPDGDFEHPSIPEGSPLRHHMLYRISRRDWLAATASEAQSA